MKACTIRITTTIDGRETCVSKRGVMQLDGERADVRYFDEKAEVSLLLQDDVLQIVRAGDYSLRLRLQEGVKHAGELSIGGESGNVSVYTRKLTYANTKNGLLLQARYALLTGGEPQETTIRLHSKFTMNEEK